MTSNQTALVLGATGGIGGAVAKIAVGTRMDHARATSQSRHLSESIRASGLRLGGDAMSASDVAAAADGIEVIVHAVNPTGYRDWGKLVLPMMRNTIGGCPTPRGAHRSTGDRM